MQRRFCEALVLDPERHRRRAAIAAGAKPGSADVVASKWLRLSNVQDYLIQLNEKATALSGASAGVTVASLAECKALLTTFMHARLGDYVTEHGEVDVARLRAAPAGLVRKYGRKVSRRVVSASSSGGDAPATSSTAIEDEHVQFELESASTAAQALIRHYDGLDRPTEQTTNMAVVFQGLPPETVASVVKGLLLGGRNGHGGNGHGPVIDVKAEE